MEINIKDITDINDIVDINITDITDIKDIMDINIKDIKDITDITDINIKEITDIMDSIQFSYTDVYVDGLLEKYHGSIAFCLLPGWTQQFPRIPTNTPGLKTGTNHWDPPRML
jgi:hypothetical protein